MVTVAAIGVGWAVSSQPNVRKAFTDLTQRAHAYDQTMTKRYELARQAKQDGVHSVVVPAVRSYPYTIVFDDIRSDPKDWKNVVFAQYFGLREVRTARSASVVD